MGFRVVLFGIALLVAEAAGVAADVAVLGVHLDAPDRIHIGGSFFTMGAGPEEQRFGLSLCRALRPAAECPAAAFSAEGPAHRVFVSAFAIDRLEVSFADYGRCQAALRCPPPRVPEPSPESAGQTHPVTGVTAAEAAGYCAFVGGRLPREAEWERAARGTSARRFPWGRQWNPRLANHAGQRGRDLLGRPIPAPAPGLQPVDSFPDGASAYGLRNMAGNAWEWTADRHAPGYYAASPAVDPTGPATGDQRVIRGGAYDTPPHLLRVTARQPFPAAGFARNLGFRCAYDVAD